MIRDKIMIAYLSGPIENASNNGSHWRDLMTDWLKTSLNHNVFNPVIETKSIVKQNLDGDFRKMKISNPNKYKKIIRKIIKLDLEAVSEKADYLIVKWDKSVFKGGGTHGEITLAYWLGKPVYLVNDLPINDVSSWIFSCSDEIFENFEDLKKSLRNIYS